MTFHKLGLMHSSYSGKCILHVNQFKELALMMETYHISMRSVYSAYICCFERFIKSSFSSLPRK